MLKEGKLIFGKAHSVVDCIIDNVSDGGAHIRITSSHGVPQDFYLVEANRGIIHKAEVAWRTTTGIGLKILGPLEDAAAREALLRQVPPQLKRRRSDRRARRGWAGAAASRAS